MRRRKLDARITTHRQDGCRHRASRGIGKAIAELCAREGVSVVLTARGEEALSRTVKGINSAGGRAVGITAVQHFMSRGDGVILHVSSVNGNRPVLGVASTTTKAAVNTLTKNIAIRFSGTKIRCNAIAPGVTDTDMAAWSSGKLPGGSKMMECAEQYVNLTVPNTKPLDQAYAALYLPSDMGTAVTGQILQVDNGGWI
jgi:3-oxoacyl-[acyl-carrier protein] reductase